MNRLPSRLPAFTIIELLVVIAIIGILMALIFPALKLVRAAGDDTQCRNNLREIGKGLMLYADEVGGGYFPSPVGTAANAHENSGRALMTALAEYIPTNSPTWVCPRYLRLNDIDMPAVTNVTYFYWAWDVYGATNFPARADVRTNRWFSRGLSTNVPGMVLVSDIFSGGPLGGPQEQYHAGGSTKAVSLAKYATHVLIAPDGSVKRASPTDGVIP